MTPVEATNTATRTRGNHGLSTTSRYHARNRRQGFWKKIFQSGPAETEEGEQQPEVELLSDTRPSAETVVLAREAADKVWIALDTLPEQQRAHPDRIRWLASLPWQYPDHARAELARCVQAGAVGVMQIANVVGEDLTHEKFAPVWAEIDRLGLPVLVHPGAPQGTRDMHLDEFGLVPPIGFMIDTTLAFARMILSGFIDTYPNVKLIAAHGGATLPYLAGRLDRCHEMIPACSAAIKDKPSEYLKRIWYDTVVYDQRALEMCIAVAGSPDRVLYGSDYPHNIGDMPGCLARVDALPGAQAKRVRGAAARELFRL